MRPVALIDVYSMFFRAHHALPPMNTTAGEPTSAMYGFSAVLIKVLREHQPEGLAFALDAPQRTFRHASYASYKAGRERTPDALTAQLGRLHQLLQALGVPAWVAPGFEADDVLATLAHKLAAEGRDVLVVSGDRDLLQVAGERVRILFLGARGRQPTLYDAAGVERRFEVTPAQLPSWMALVGDSSDNLPGVASIGPRTAAKLVRQFGTMDHLVANLADVGSPKLREVLSLAAGQVRLNEHLARLRVDAPLEPLPWRLSRATVPSPPDPLGRGDALAAPITTAALARVRELFGELEFTSLTDRLRPLESALGEGD